ncbi:MAG: four-carbon acid sugar kinase family protein [Planctomycetaceae bacterium]
MSGAPNSDLKIVVLDDDPTGTQSVHDTTVLLQWDVDLIADELRRSDAVFYLLTNSRALVESEAVSLAARTGRQIQEASKKAGVAVLVVSRSDSTLRGHYPAEVDALAAALGDRSTPQLLVPAFIDGGRVTVDGEHCIRDSNGELTRVCDTEFARDATFGFTTSFMPDYVQEKTQGAVSSHDVIGVPAGAQVLPKLEAGTVAYANAGTQTHLEDLSRAILTAIGNGQELLIRSAASLVPCLAGMSTVPFWEPSERSSDCGGLVVVGSYVQKSTQQLSRLRDEMPEACYVELDVDRVLNEEHGALVDEVSDQLSESMTNGELAVLFTARDLVSDPNPDRARSIGQKVASVLNECVRSTIQKVTPAFVLGKGGITSSDLAGVSLGCRRARVLGQVVPGVSVWELDSLPGVPYVVFPGNVGDQHELLNVVSKLV